jgi:hypothetical protein
MTLNLFVSADTPCSLSLRSILLKLTQTHPCTTVQAAAQTTTLSVWKLLLERFNSDRFHNRQYNNKREVNRML